MRGNGSFARCASTVAIEHLAAAPTGQAHEITLAAAPREPAMGEGMPKLVRVESIAKARLPSSLSYDLGDTAVGQPALSTDPQPGKLGVCRPLSHPDVPIEGSHRLRADGDNALASPFTEHPQDALIEVDVVRSLVGRDETKPSDLGPSRARIDEHADQRGIAAVFEA